MLEIIRKIKNEIWNMFLDFKKIFTHPKIFFLWISILPFNLIFTICVIVTALINYFIFLFIFLFKCIQKISNIKNNVKPIKINNKKLLLKNYILITIYSLTIRLGVKYGFLILYKQLYFLTNINNIDKDGKIIDKIKVYLEIFFFVIMKRIFFYITSLPFFFVKNNNKITLLINDVINIEAENYEAYISTICYNLIYRYTIDINEETKKLKIKFNKRRKKNKKKNSFFYLNPKIFLDIDIKTKVFLNSLKEKGKLSKGTEILLKNGQISMLKYKVEGKDFRPHPSIYFSITDEYDNNKPAIFVVNQSTKKKLVVSMYENNEIKKYEIKNKIDTKGILDYKKDAYIVTPHWTKTENVTLISSKKLIENWYKTENWVKQFSFVQSFVANLETEMYKIDKNHGVLEDTNYKNVKDYILKNYTIFSKDVQIGLEDIIDFYDKNKDIIEINGEELDFVKCIYLVEINSNIRHYLLDILNKSN